MVFYRFRRSLLALLCLSISGSLGQTSCRLIPGDEGWPAASEWDTFNQTVGGRLIATVPQASVCHSSPYSNYNESECEILKSGWSLAQTFELKPAEIINAYYQNQSCDPFTPTDQSCELGNYAAYSVSVSGADDVVAALDFAKSKNLRIVVRTTGHDYNGKSTGQGALSLWMYNLKTTEVTKDYSSPSYSGPAIKLGAGVVVGEAYEAAHAEGYRIVGGECGSVAMAGGYSQGSGHSILNTAYGMAADNVLEWELITAEGEHLITTPEENSDLYWALSGGSPGSFGVVLSMTAKLHDEGRFAGGALVLDTASLDDATFYQAVQLWYQHFPAFIVNGNTIQWVLMNNTFNIQSINLPDQDVAVLETLLTPYTDELQQLNITYNLTSAPFDTYYDYFDHFYGPLPYGPQPPSTILNSRLIPRSVLADPNSTAQLVAAYRETVADGTFLVGCSGMDVSGVEHPDNAVLPAWRDAIAICIVNAFWDFTAPLADNLAVKQELVSVHAPAIDAATPGSGVYMNEIDPWYQGDWKETMYGVNYDRLLEIKRRYDPDSVFYGHFAVGSDEHTVDGAGRLCKA